jgi:hypothetical protein
MTETVGEVIGRDMDCLGCGYNLRGLRADGASAGTAVPALAPSSVREEDGLGL